MGIFGLQPAALTHFRQLCPINRKQETLNDGVFSLMMFSSGFPAVIGVILIHRPDCLGQQCKMANVRLVLKLCSDESYLNNYSYKLPY